MDYLPGNNTVDRARFNIKNKVVTIKITKENKTFQFCYKGNLKQYIPVEQEATAKTRNSNCSSRADFNGLQLICHYIAD